LRILERVSTGLKLFLGIWMSGVLVAAFLYAPPALGLGEASRVIYFHIPVAWVAVLAFLVSMVSAIQYLRTRETTYDDRANVAAQLGFLFCLLATVTGSIFARITWGSFWNWDPRETSIFILLLIYAAYFALRTAVEDDERRARLAAVYSIIAFITVPFLVFVVPRIYFSLHPEAAFLSKTGGLTMNRKMLQVFLGSLAGFTGIFVWLYRLQLSITRWQHRLFYKEE